MKKISLNSNRKSTLKCLKICKKLQTKVKYLEDKMKQICTDSSAQLPESIAVNSLNQDPAKNLLADIDKNEQSLIDIPELFCNIKYLGYMTICSSVQTSGRTQEIVNDPQKLVKKQALGGATLDVVRLENYLFKLGSLVHRQAKYEYSAESVSAASKEEFIKSLCFFYDNIRNESCLLFYSGHGLRDTSLVFETAVENYHIAYDDVITHWKTRTNLNNKHLFIVLDCCYSGSWVIELFRNGDFRSVSIQASSTFEQTSNDLGSDIGSLFTALITKENGLKFEMSLSDPRVKSGMDCQTPMAFCGKWGMSSKVFKKIGFNSWGELTLTYTNKQVKSTNGVTSIFREIPGLFEYAALIIDEDRLLIQGELNFKPDKPNKTCFVTAISRPNSPMMLGCVSIWLNLGKLNGIFFRELKSKRYAFEISEENLNNALEKLKDWFNAHENFNSTIANFESLDCALKLLTEMDKNNLIQNEELIDGTEEEINLDLLKAEHLCPLESLKIVGELSKKMLEKLLSHIHNDVLAVKSLNIEKYTNEFPAETSSLRNLDSLSVTITESTHLSLLDELVNMPFSCKDYCLKFSNNTTSKALASPLLLSNLKFSSSLISLSLTNVHKIYYKDLVLFIESTISLTRLSLENCDFEMSQSNILMDKIFSNTIITSISLINANISTDIIPHPNITYLNLSSNKLITFNVKSLLKVQYLRRYSIDLSFNYINKHLLPELSQFLRDNKQCNEFNLSGNNLSSDILSLIRMNLLYKCTISDLNLSETDLSSCDFKNLTSLLCKAKQLKHLNLKSCNLNTSKLSEVMNIINNEFSTSITSIDISYNIIISEDFFKILRLRVKYSASLHKLFMAGCIDIEASKPLSCDGFFGGNLTCIDYSNWKATNGFDVRSKIGTSLKQINLIDFCFSSESKLNFESLDLDSLVMNSSAISYIILPRTCKSLKIEEIDNAHISQFKNIISKAEILQLSMSTNELDEFLAETLINTDTCCHVKDKSELCNLDLLMLENIDEASAKYVSEVMNNNSNILNCSIKQLGHNSIDISRMIPCIDYALKLDLVPQHVLDCISEELYKVLVQMNYFDKHDSNTLHIINNSPYYFQIDVNHKCLVFQGNFFDPDFLGIAKYEALELVEFNSVYLKVMLPLIETFVINNPNIKVLIFKDSELNNKEIKSICSIVATIKHTIEELHLVNSFVDTKEIKCLLTVLLECNQLRTLNLSGNLISTKPLIEFAVSHSKLDSLILRNCALSKENIEEALKILMVKPMKLMDFSGLRLNEYVQKTMINTSSKWDNEKFEDFALEISYSNQLYLSHRTHQLQILHLNQINFDLNSNLISRVLQGVECIPLVIATRCQEENSFVKNLFLLTKYTKIKTLDLSGNLMTETNTKFLICIIKNQIHQLESKNFKVILSQTNLEDNSFELIYDYVYTESKSPSILFDLSCNMLTSLSYKFIQFLNQAKKVSFEVNLKNAFSAEFKTQEMKEYCYLTRIKNPIALAELEYERYIRMSMPNMSENQDEYTTVLLRVNEDLIICGCSQGSIKIWQISSAVCTKTISGHLKGVNSLISRSEDLIISGSDDHTIKMWQVSTAICIKTFYGHSGSVTEILQFSDDVIASSSNDQTIRLWDIGTCECISVIEGHNHFVGALIQLSDHVLASGSYDKTIRLWDTSDVDNIVCIATLIGHKDSIDALLKINEFSMLSGSADNSIRLWNIQDNTCMKIFEGHKSLIYDLVMLNDQLLVSGSSDATLKLWDISSAKCIKTITGSFENVITLIRMSVNEVIISSSNCIVSLLKLTSNDDIPLQEIEYESHIIFSEIKGIAVLAKMKDNLVVSGVNSLLRFHDLENYDFTEYEASQSDITCLIKFDDDLLIFSSYAMIRVWKISIESTIFELSGHTDYVKTLLKLSNRLIASGSDDKTIKIWDIFSESCLKTFDGHKFYVIILIKLSDDLIASGSIDATIKVWQVSVGTLIQTLSGHECSVTALVSLPDDKIASGSGDKSIRIWQRLISKCIMVLTGHNDIIDCLIKMHNDLLASGSSDCTIRMWRVSSGECIKVLEDHKGTIYSLIKVNEELILSASNDNTIRVWKVSSSFSRNNSLPILQ